MIRLFICFGIFILPCFTWAQQDPDKAEDGEETEKTEVSPFLFAGVMAGGYVDAATFVYRDGITVNGGLLWKRSKRVHLGFSLGVDKLNDEYFLPAGLMALGFRKKKDESFFFGLNAGYALGLHNGLYADTRYSFRGGLYFQPMIGYKTEVKGTGLMIGLAYRHQFAEVRYLNDGGGYFREDNNYHLLSLRAGVIF